MIFGELCVELWVLGSRSVKLSVVVDDTSILSSSSRNSVLNERLVVGVEAVLTSQITPCGGHHIIVAELAV